MNRNFIATAGTAAVALAAGVALAAASAARAESPSWYVQGNAGAVFDSTLDGPVNRDGGAGYVLGGQAGRDFGNGWRTDAEVLYMDAPNRHALAGRTSMIGGFANAYYNFNHGHAWQPFVGGGVGAADVRSIGQDDAGFAWQVKAGIDHPFNDRLTGEIAYRYVGVQDVSAGTAPAAFRGDYHSSAVTVGLRYRFGG